MSVIIGIWTRIFIRLGWLAIIAGSVVIVAETAVGFVFTPTTGRIDRLVTKCELVDTSYRYDKILANGDCADMREKRQELFSQPLEIRPYSVAAITFHDAQGKEVTSDAHVAGLSASHPKPGDIVPILYDPANPATVRGPTNRTAQGFGACAILAGILMLSLRHRTATTATPPVREFATRVASPAQPARTAPTGGFGRRH